MWSVRFAVTHCNSFEGLIWIFIICTSYTALSQFSIIERPDTNFSSRSLSCGFWVNKTGAPCKWWFWWFCCFFHLSLILPFSAPHEQGLLCRQIRSLQARASPPLFPIIIGQKRHQRCMKHRLLYWFSTFEFRLFDTWLIDTQLFDTWHSISWKCLENFV